MPTIILEGPQLTLSRKRRLTSALTRIVAQAYGWPVENVVVVIHENESENVGRGGVLLRDRKKRQVGSRGGVKGNSLAS